ncbi:MAG TPA: hypothetical protein VGO68_07360 [Pyrinomonadaceae bacterium]|jgi:hypothetical protein|nr:hypothetical protein [Pyrinomonadaceae bacterium]
MANGVFKYEDDLLKHFIRTTAWLPLCQNRLATVRAGAPRPKDQRRLKYFTFCAVGAIDVLMLDVANVIRQSSDGRFDTVFFFDRSPEYVLETQKRIPGAIGFPGDFTSVVLAQDPEEDTVIDSEAPLGPALNSADVRETRLNQLLVSQRRDFIQNFPFDVINLDLEEFLLKPNDEFPGKVIGALRNVFKWQKRALNIPGRPSRSLNGFSLMFTTQIGPPNLTDEYLGMLRDRISNNLAIDAELLNIMVRRTGLDDPILLQQGQFETFFKIGMPKVLTSILMDADWYVDPEYGLKIYEIERPTDEGSYKMLHLVMDVKRHNPDEDHRAPGDQSAEAQGAYRTLVRQVFSTPETVVSADTIDEQGLQANLDLIKARRRKYFDPDAEDGQ